jgi:predicted nucleic acid-binding protein
MRARYLLDTNHLSPALDAASRIRERLLQTHRAGYRLGTCIPVLCELETGIQQTSDPDSARRTLRHLFRHLRLWPIEQSLARVYGEVYLELRRKGRVLSQVDMILAALSRIMNLTLLTSDRDFAALPDSRTENWLI